MAEKGLGAVLVSSPANCFYLTNFEKPRGDFRAIELLVTEDEIYLFTNPLYEGSVKNWLHGHSKRGPLVNPHKTKVFVSSARRSLLDDLQQMVTENKLKVLGFEENDLNLGEYYRLEKKVEGVKLVGADSLFQLLRQTKDQEEITAIKQACRITDLTFEQILKLVKPGLTESEIALEIDYHLRRNGAEESAFETIVASGPNNAIPHHKTGNRKLKPRDIVLLDFGARYQGYCSDMSRTVFLDQPTNEQQRAYQEVLEAQDKALKGIKPGLMGQQADQLARDSLKKSGFGKFFIHNLGHNLGLNIHEPPSLGPGSKERLAEGMVFSVEPGLYFPPHFGIRIEETVTIRNGQLEVLTHSDKNLLSL